MLERLKITRRVVVEEGDADARVDGKPAVLPGEDGKGVVHGWFRGFREMVTDPRKS
jgi:hypothetical protein